MLSNATIETSTDEVAIEDRQNLFLTTSLPCISNNHCIQRPEDSSTPTYQFEVQQACGYGAAKLVKCE